MCEYTPDIHLHQTPRIDSGGIMQSMSLCWNARNGCRYPRKGQKELRNRRRWLLRGSNSNRASAAQSSSTNQLLTSIKKRIRKFQIHQLLQVRKTRKPLLLFPKHFRPVCLVGRYSRVDHLAPLKMLERVLVTKQDGIYVEP